MTRTNAIVWACAGAAWLLAMAWQAGHSQGYNRGYDDGFAACRKSFAGM